MSKTNVLNFLEKYSLEARGNPTLFLFSKETGEVKKIIESSNLILFSGADILANLLGGRATYAVNTMYLEFKNLADPDDSITLPSYTRADGIDYYNGLSASLDTDFLRIPLTVSPELSASGSDYSNNQVTFFGISEGTTGFNGLTFDPSVNSAVYGAALIATPGGTDQSQDVVFSRYYAGSPGWADKILKETGFQIGVVWPIRFN